MSFSVQEVAQLLKQAKENQKPYVFFTGAGCSISAGVPSAIGLIEEIRNQFPTQVKNIDHEKDQFNYGKYMSVLDKDERRRLLKPHIIDNKNINWAHIALACLMQSGFVQRVLTFNFDSILSRACNLLGLHPSIYDFATANPHLYHLINDPSIVHLHGQGTGFIQLNTEKETKDHIPNLNDFIAATLNSNPSLFIGYSGNADEFFPLLKEKYSEQHRLIWTGRKENINDIEADSVKDFLKHNKNLTHYIGGIDADYFLIQLAKELDCFPPQIFLNPYQFIGEQLKLIQKYPLGDGIDILENLSHYLAEQASKPLTLNLYTSFIHKYRNKDSVAGLDPTFIEDIIWAYNKQALLNLKEKKYNESIALLENALLIKPDHIYILLNLANAHLEQSKTESSNSILDKALIYAKKALEIQPNLNSAIQTYADILLAKGSFEKSINLLSEAIGLYKRLELRNNTYTSHISNYALALSELAVIQKDDNKFDESFKLYELALKSAPDDIETLENYISSLFESFNLSKNNSLLEKALSAIQQVLIFKPNDTYNLACYHSLNLNIEKAKNLIIHAKEHNTLPNYDHLINDKDLDNIRNEKWFIELIAHLKTKEETDKLT